MVGVQFVSMEQKVLAGCVRSRSAYEKAMAGNFHDQAGVRTQAILKVLGEYYERDPDADKADPKLLFDELETAYPKHAEDFKAILKNLPDVSPENVAHMVWRQREEELRREAANALLGGDDDTAQQSVLDWQTFRNIDSSGETNRTLQDTNPFEDAQSMRAGLIRPPLTDMQQACDGGFAGGDHIIIFARPEVGKTGAAVAFTGAALRQDKRVLYITNEDQGYKIQRRVMCNLTGRPQKDLESKPQKALEISRKKGYKNLKVVAMFPGTLLDIEAEIREFEPDMVIVDQLRNLTLKAGSDGFVFALDRLAQGLRNLGKRYKCVMVSLVQAGDSADGKTFLEMGDVDFSNTGVPAAADVLCGIGDGGNIDAPSRFFALSKNKLGGVHHRWRATFDKQTNTFN